MSAKITIEVANNYIGINKEVPNINYGGCGIFAEHLYYILIKLGVNCKIGVICNSDSKYGFECAVKNKDYDNMYGLRHIVIIVGNKMLDSNGVHTSLNDFTYIGVCISYAMKIEHLCEANDMDVWNPTFNRRHIKTIENKLNIVYKKTQENLVV